jgi:hypothetical protein
MSQRITAENFLASGKDVDRALALSRALSRVAFEVEEEITSAIKGAQEGERVDFAKVDSRLNGLLQYFRDEEGKISGNRERVAALRKLEQDDIQRVQKQINTIAGAAVLSMDFEAHARPKVSLVQTHSFYCWREHFILAGTGSWERAHDYYKIKNDIVKTNDWDRNVPNYLTEQVYVLPREVGVPIRVGSSAGGMTITEWDSLPTVVDLDDVEGGAYDFKVVGSLTVIRDLVGEVRLDEYTDPASQEPTTVVPTGEESGINSIITILEFGLAFAAIVFEGSMAGLVTSAVLEVGEIIADDVFYTEAMQIVGHGGPSFGDVANEKIQYDGPVAKMVRRSGRVTGTEGSSRGRSFGKAIRHTQRVAKPDGTKYPKVFTAEELDLVSADDNNFYGIFEGPRGNPYVSKTRSHDASNFSGVIQTTPHTRKFATSKESSITFKAIVATTSTVVEFSESAFSELQGLDAQGRMSWHFDGTLQHPDEYDADGNLVSYDTVFIGSCPYAWYDGVTWQTKDISDVLL